MFSRLWFFVAIHVIGTVFFIRTAGFENFSLNNVKKISIYMLILVPLLVLIGLAYQFTKKKYFDDGIPFQGKAVLITGCDHGFGHILAKHLDAKGFRVFACCHISEGSGAKNLKRLCSEKLEVLELDVARDESVINLKNYVEKCLGTDELWAIVNNAGILKGMSFDFSDVQDFQECMEVNAIGAVRVTKALLPLLKKSKGRIINLTGVLGRTTHPFMLPYIMSKYASVAFTEALRQELNVWGIKVIAIEPENFRAPCADIEKFEKHLDELFSSIPENIREDYGETYFKNLKNLILWFGSHASENVHKVVVAMELAITSIYPKDEYTPCRSANFCILLWIYIRLPRFFRDFILKIILCYVFSLIPERVYDDS